MAFYSTRVDDNGNELERRHTARSVNNANSPMPLAGHSSRNISARSCDGPMSGVRYINRAAFIEHGSELSDLESCVSMSEAPTDSLLDSATSDGRSNIVPPLDLQSEENYPTNRNGYTFSCRKPSEAAKIVLKPDAAYETWLSAKRKLSSTEAVRRKRVADEQRKAAEERKRVAELKYEQWLQQKSRPQVGPKQKASLSQTEHEARQPKQTISEEEAIARREEWERAKRMEDERRRYQKRLQAEQQRLLEEQRRQLSAGAWEKWMVDAASKPKPVPLNRGFFTLRGTISDIFVNPNEWQTVDAINE